MRINQRTKLIGLIGYPLNHSFSPLMHNAALESTNLNYVYLAMPVPPGSLSYCIYGIKAFKLSGNITLPHKETIIPFLDYLTDEAEIVGAVNTFYWRENKLIGDNTDVDAFIQVLNNYKIDILGRTVTIIGSGGAARAIALACAQLSAKEVIIFTKKIENISKFIQDISLVFPDTIWLTYSSYTTSFVEDFARSHLVINASPVGMFPNPNLSPLEEKFFKILLPDTHVYDVVYNPIETKFLKLAKKNNLKVYNGLDLLVEQAAISFYKWFNRYPPKEVMKTVLKNSIEIFIEKESKIKPIDLYG